MFAIPLAFPEACPAAYRPITDDPPFDSGRHLSLEAPRRIWSLEDLGYEEKDLARSPSGVGFTSTFRVLSREGADALTHVVRQLQRFTQQASELETYDGNRNQTFLAGGVYRSRFIRDLCGSTDIADFLSEIAGTRIAPHSMPSQQAYINYAPRNPSEHVDIWHADSIDFDYVLMASDPGAFKGGEFEVFQGTTYEAAEFAGLSDGVLNRGIGDVIPDERIVSFRFPDCGFGVFQQGRYVVHRAKKLLEPGERMTIVPGYVSLDLSYNDAVDVSHIATYGEPGLGAEVLRHGAWRAREKLRAAIDAMDPNSDLEAQRSKLDSVMREIQRVIDATRRLGSK